MYRTLHMDISVGVVGSGWGELDSQEGCEVTGEVGYEGRSAVADHFLWKSVMAPDVFQEQLGDSGGIQGGDCGYGMNPFRQTIHHHEGGIVPLGVWEFSNHVYRDHLPASVRDLVGDQLPHLLCQEGFGPVACITSCDKLSNVPRQPWPPVTTCTSGSGGRTWWNPTGDDWVSSMHEHGSGVGRKII